MNEYGKGLMECQVRRLHVMGLYMTCALDVEEKQK